FMLARTPAGCSYISTRLALSRLTGILGDDSIERNRRKSLFGLSDSMRFSRLCSHVGARWTFLTSTHEPVWAALAIALAALATPSVEPMAMLVQRTRSRSTRDSTLYDASKPGVETRAIGRVAGTWSTVCLRSSTM